MCKRKLSQASDINDHNKTGGTITISMKDIVALGKTALAIDEGEDDDEGDELDALIDDLEEYGNEVEI